MDKQMKRKIAEKNGRDKLWIACVLLAIGISSCVFAIYSYYFLIPGFICLVPALGFIIWYLVKFKKLKLNDSSTKKIKRKEDLKIYHVKQPTPTYKYSPPDGYAVDGWTHVRAKVRGCQYYIDKKTDICVGDGVLVIHEPNGKYPENTPVYINNVQVGTLKQDMAIDWYLKYGTRYQFEGTVAEYSYSDYPTLIIEISRPILRKLSGN